MLQYFQYYVVEHNLGYGYIFTNLTLVLGAILLLHDFPARQRPLRVCLESLAGFLVYFLMDSLYFWAFGGWQIDRVILLLFIVLYAAVRSRYDFRVRIIRGAMYYAGSIVMIPVSEPVGELLAGINSAYMLWGQYLTPLIIALMAAGEVWFLRHFSYDDGAAISRESVWLQVTVSLMIVLVESYAILSGIVIEHRAFNVLVCLSLWAINLLAYYLFFTINQSVQTNVQLNALRQKAEMEKEKYYATRLNYEELRALRHEMKNHNFYLQALLDEGKVEEARAYLRSVTTQGAPHLQSFDSGNEVIDIVMNHELAAAREQHVQLNTSILVPHRLPLRDVDLCSLLSNLLDNAIEAATQSGEENPTVEVSILPRQEYLFIRVINPVDPSVPENRRMSLKTTKTHHTELHGYGTRIIRRITEKYNGSVKYSMASGRFVTDVMLDMPEEENNT